MEDLKIQEAQLHYIRKAEPTKKITNAQQGYEIAMKIYEPWQLTTKEFFYVIYLNSANQIIEYAKISEGAINGTTADIRIILAHALKSGATAMIFFHNHPSGQRKPSQADIKLTKEAHQAAKIMNISLLDHIIVTPKSGYYSLAESGDF